MPAANLIIIPPTLSSPMEEDASLTYGQNLKPTSSLNKNSYSPQAGINNNLPPAAIRNNFFAEQKGREYMKLYAEFLLKWESCKSDFSDFTEPFIFENVKLVIAHFLSLNPSYVLFELTDDNSVFFQALVNEKNIYVELYFTNDVKEGVEAIANIYQYGKCIFAYGNTIENTFLEISLLEISLRATLPSAYELSGQTFASTPL